MTDESNYVIAIHRAVLIGRGNYFGIRLWFFDSHLKSASNNAKDKNSFFSSNVLLQNKDAFTTSLIC